MSVLDSYTVRIDSSKWISQDLLLRYIQRDQYILKQLFHIPKNAQMEIIALRKKKNYMGVKSCLLMHIYVGKSK